MSSQPLDSATPFCATPRIIPVVVAQHVEDAAVLWAQRSELVRRGHVKLHQLRRFDDRLAAHLDGLCVAGPEAWPLCLAALEKPSEGAMFTATRHALEARRSAKSSDRLDLLFSAVQGDGPGMRGLLSAFAWQTGDVSWQRGKSCPANEAIYRRAVVTAAALRRRDVADELASHELLSWARSPHAAIRARAWRAAGELGRRELVSTCAASMLEEKDEACRFWSAWSAVLLGDRESALALLASLAMQPGPWRERAFDLVLLAMPVPSAHQLLQPLSRQPSETRRLIRGAGRVGDPRYIPWLIGNMSNDELARVAGEAFSFITGADLAALDLERPPPDDLASGPNDDPANSHVAMDEDEGLPWPDAARVQAWWAGQSQQFVAGTRYFVGAPLSDEQCCHVLRTGYQRQRIAAALHRCLLVPGTALFEWRAPARDQQRELASLENLR